MKPARLNGLRDERALPMAIKAGPTAKGRFRQPTLTVSRDHLHQDLVSSLVDGQTGILRIPDALLANDFEELRRTVQNHPMEFYLDPVVGKLGPSHFEHRHCPEEYFRLAKDYREASPALAKASCRTVTEAVDLLERVGLSDVQAAVHRSGNTLNEVVFRDIRDGVPLHVDWHAVDIPNWLDDSIHAQLSWCIYLDVPPVGGELRVFPTQWKPEDETQRLTSSFEFLRSVIPWSCEPACVIPRVGDFVLFNTKNYHDVTPADAIRPRLSASAFVGVAGSHGFLWS